MDKYIQAFKDGKAMMIHTKRQSYLVSNKVHSFAVFEAVLAKSTNITVNIIGE